jgi:hypothetical protein
MESVLIWAFENLVAVTICGFGSLCFIIRSGIKRAVSMGGIRRAVPIGPRHQLSGIKRAVSKERYQKSGTNCPFDLFDIIVIEFLKGFIVHCAVLYSVLKY